MSGSLTISDIIDIAGTIDAVTSLTGSLSFTKFIGWLHDRPAAYDPDLYWDEETETWGSGRVTIPGAFVEYLIAVGEEGEVYFGIV